MSITTSEFCVVCGDDRELQRKQKAVEYTVRNEKVNVDLPVTLCPVCRTEEVAEGFGRDPVELAYEAYRNKHNLLKPSEIKETRERYRLSQKSFAKLLGMSEATINRYEQGALQDATHDNAIRAFQVPEFFRDALNRRGELLSDWQRARVQEAITAGDSWEEAYKSQLEAQVAMPRERTGRTGYKPFDLEKYSAVVVWLCSNMSAVTPTKLNKLAFYLDFLYFKRSSVSFTGAGYRRIQFGPVPADYRGIQKYLESRGLVEVVERDYKNGNTGEEYRSGPQAKSFKFGFSESEVSALSMIREVFDKLTPREISEKSHDERAWKETPESEFISYKFAKSLSID